MSNLSRMLKNNFVLIICCIFLFIINCSIFMYDTYPIAKAESMAFFYPSYIIQKDNSAWCDYYMGLRCAEILPLQFFFLKYFLINETYIKPFYTQFFFYLILIYMGYFGFYLLLNLKKSSEKNIFYVYSLIYILNPVSLYFFNRFQYTFLSMYLGLPLLSYILIKYLSCVRFKKSIFYLITYNVLLITVLTLIIGSLRIFFIFVIYKFLFFFAFFIYHLLNRNVDKIINFFIKTTVFIISFILLHLFWLSPLSQQLTIENIFFNSEQSVFNATNNIETLTAISNISSGILNILSLVTDFFYESVKYFKYVNFIYIYYLIALLPFFSIVFLSIKLAKKNSKIHKNQYVIVFSILLILYFFISRGDTFPFGYFYKKSFEYIPLLQVFRNPFEKGMLVYPLSFLIILGFILKYFFINSFSTKFKKVFYTFFIIYILIINFSLFNGNLLTSDNDPRLELPDEYSVLKNKLKDNGISDRVLVFPVIQEAVTYNWRYKSYKGADFIPFYISNNSYGFQTQDYYSERPYILSNLEFAKDKNSLLELYGFRYVLYRNDYDFISEEQKNPQISYDNLVNNLNFSLNSYVKIEDYDQIIQLRGTDEIFISRNNNYTPMLNSTYISSQIFYNPIPQTNKYRSFKINIKLSLDEPDNPLLKINSAYIRSKGSRSAFEFYRSSECQLCYTSNLITNNTFDNIDQVDFKLTFSKPVFRVNFDTIAISYPTVSEKDFIYTEVPIFKDKNYRLLSLNKTLPELYSTDTLVTYDNQNFFLDNSLLPGKVSYVDKLTSSKLKYKDEKIALVDIKYSKSGNYKYDLTISKTKENQSQGILTFNTSIDPLWELKPTDNPNVKVQHFKSNTFANTWIISNLGDNPVNFTLTYLPQEKYIFYSYLSFGYLIFLVILLIFLHYRDNARLSK